ncbi:MAG: hypothetical protein JNL62_17795, partial [Bryobacterales bacterium]|nr:hypothetical protein [Bryobacterales bacterium]
GVRLIPVPVGEAFPGSVEDGALQWACAKDLHGLRNFFGEARAPFESALVRQREEGQCHIHYRPTLEGFSAAQENAPVSELFLSIDGLAFLAQREGRIGDSLDVVRTLLTRFETPLRVTLAISGDESNRHFQSAAKKFFDQSIHPIRYMSIPQANGDPWVQDFLKAGHVGSEEKILVTRAAYEGQEALGAGLRPLLDSFAGPRFVRSRLSFEGGDLIIARDPREPQKRILFHGTSAKPYWGEALTMDEFAYVLRREFGTEKSIYLGDITPHADYTISILGDRPVALVAQPVCGERELALGAVDVLMETYGESIPELIRIQELLTNNGEIGELRSDKLLQAIERAKSASVEWKAPVDAAVRARIEGHVRENCPQRPMACIEGTSLAHLLDTQRGLLLDWVEAGAQLRTGQVMASRMLGAMEHQAQGCGAADGLQEVREKLKAVGFAVIPVPWIEPGKATSKHWPGVSYVNAALVGGQLFLPSLGLGRIEEEWLQELQRQLPKGIEASYVPARFSLMQNGGIHCLIAFGREGSW